MTLPPHTSNNVMNNKKAEAELRVPALEANEDGEKRNGRSTRDDSDDDNVETKDHSYFLSSVILIFIAPGFGGFLFGYDIGASSYAISAFSDEDYWKKDDEWRIGLFTAATTIAAFVGSLIIFPIADKIGRRQELIYSSILYFIGALWQALPSIYIYVFTPNKFVMSDTIFWYGFILGRFIYGLGIGITMHGAPAYLGEMIPSTIRGKLLSLKEVFIVLGMLAGYIFGYILEVDEDEKKNEEYIRNNDIWAYAYLYSVALSFTMFVILKFYLPPSYRWLILRGRSDEALESLRFLYKPEYAEEQYQILMKSMISFNNVKDNECNNDEEHYQQMHEEKSEEKSSLHSLFFDPKLRSSLIAGFGLVILQQISGQPSVLEYVATIFKDLGISALSSVLVAFFKVLSSMVAFILVEKYGRRFLLFLGVSLMLTGCIVLVAFTATATNTIPQDSTSRTATWMTMATMLSQEEEKDSKFDAEFYGTVLTKDQHMKSFILIAMFIYIGGYQIGFGPITWLTMSEIFPLSIRGQALSIAIQLNFLLNATIEFGMAPMLQESLGLSNTFAIFSIILIFSLYFIHHYVLETKGLTLEEVEKLYKDKNDMRRRRKKITSYAMS